MNGICLLAIRHALHARGTTLILAVCFALTMFVPATAYLLYVRFERTVTIRADSTPLVAGAVGSRLDLTLAATHFRDAALPTIPFGAVMELTRDDLARGIGLRLGRRVRGHPLVGVDHEYFAFRQLRLAGGTLPALLGDAVLGAVAQRALDGTTGTTLYSDQDNPYDLAAPSAVRLQVVGVLAPTGTPDDQAVFVSLETAWLLDGYLHGHDTVAALKPEHITGTATRHTVVGPTLIEDHEVTAENVDTFHMHGDRADLPLSAIIVIPHDDRARTILRTRVQASRLHQMAEPRSVFDDLLASVLRVKRLVDVVAVVLGISTLLLTVLVVGLSTRMRADESLMLHNMGCAQGTLVRLYAVELLMILTVSAVLAAAGVGLVGSTVSALALAETVAT